MACSVAALLRPCSEADLESAAFAGALVEASVALAAVVSVVAVAASTVVVAAVLAGRQHASHGNLITCDGN